ncbi:MAG: pseudouridine synthase [Bacteroidota bacterium]|nr:pseudouridine synthase [Bacteroidota bacterium]
MVSKRPRNSRDDKSGRSSNRTSQSTDKSKRSTSSNRNSSAGFEKKDNSKPGKKFSNERPGEKSPFSKFEKRSSPKRNDGDKPTSSFSDGAGEKRSFSPRNKPYTGRAADNEDRPKRSFGGESSGDRNSFTARKKPYSGRIADTGDSPKRNFGGGSAGEKRSFPSQNKSYSGRPNDSDERPKRTPDGYRGGGDGPSGKKFGDKPSGGFKKRDDRSPGSERPQRSKSGYDRITRDESAPVKTLRGRKKAPETKDTGLIRLNRYISNAGICSRRKADELISAGVVSVNGTVISELGHKVDPQKDEIRYNGELLKREKMVYVLLNKPKDYITTTEDPQERRTVMHLVEKASKERIYPIGRLDRNTTGLLLMTNDGDLADKLSHPKNNIVKLYQVELNKNLIQGDLNKIAFGLELEDGLIKPDTISYVAGGSKREIGIQIHSGKNRIVRRIFEHLGYDVVKLDRAVYANLTKKDLPRGRWRFLEESEVIQLKHLI